LESQLVGVELQLRRRKWFDALKCLQKARELAFEDVGVHEAAVKMRRAVNEIPEDEAFKKPQTRESLLKEMEKILPKDKDLVKYNEDFLEAHQNSVAHVSSALRVHALLKPEEKDVTQLISSLDKMSLVEAVQGIELLHDLRVDETKYREKARSIFPLAKVFKVMGSGKA